MLVTRTSAFTVRCLSSHSPLNSFIIAAKRDNKNFKRPLRDFFFLGRGLTPVGSRTGGSSWQDFWLGQFCCLSNLDSVTRLQCRFCKSPSLTLACCFLPRGVWTSSPRIVLPFTEEAAQNSRKDWGFGFS